MDNKDKGLTHIAFSVKDLDVSIAFYEKFADISATACAVADVVHFLIAPSFALHPSLRKCSLTPQPLPSKVL